MEALTRLVTESLARHGLDRPVDPRRLQWSRWSRCDSPHSLLVVPSKPGIFALAEEVAAFGGASESHGRNPERSEGSLDFDTGLPGSRRMLAVLQFSEDDNMAYVLDRMFTYANPMRSRLHSGNCFIRFVVIEDHEQRRSICAALNQWMRNSAEKATGLPADFSSSIELALENVAWAPSPASRLTDAGVAAVGPKTVSTFTGAHSDSEAGKNLHCPQPFPSGF